MRKRKKEMGVKNPSELICFFFIKENKSTVTGWGKKNHFTARSFKMSTLLQYNFIIDVYLITTTIPDSIRFVSRLVSFFLLPLFSFQL